MTNEQEPQHSIPQNILDDIYIALSESYERLDCGKMNLKRCINYLESEHGYEPPRGYKND